MSTVPVVTEAAPSDQFPPFDTVAAKPKDRVLLPVLACPANSVSAPEGRYPGQSHVIGFSTTSPIPTSSTLLLLDTAVEFGPMALLVALVVRGSTGLPGKLPSGL